MNRLVLVLFPAFLVSCIEEIDLNIDNNRPSIVIDGQIGDIYREYTIEVKKSAVIGVGSDNIFTPIEGVNVTVYDGDGNHFEFLETGPGVYATEMQGEVGRSYYTEIILSDGTVIRSTPGVLYRAPEIGDITTDIYDRTFVNGSGNINVETRLKLMVNVTFPDMEDLLFLRWRADGIYEFKENYPGALGTKLCFVENKVDNNNLKIFDSRRLAGNQIVDEVFIDTKLDYRFTREYRFAVEQYAMTEQEYLYWASVNDIINIDGSLFDPPPGTVRGNLFNVDNPEEIIVGYFSVNGIAQKYFFANPKSLNQVYIDDRCEGSWRRPLPAECYDCLVINNSTLAFPDDWSWFLDLDPN